MAVDIWSYRETVDEVDLSDYHVEAVDGEIGKVDQRDVRDRVATRSSSTRARWCSAERCSSPSGTIERIDPESKTIYVDRTKDEIKHAPEYDPSGYARAGVPAGACRLLHALLRARRRARNPQAPARRGAVRLASCSRARRSAGRTAIRRSTRCRTRAVLGDRARRPPLRREPAAATPAGRRPVLRLQLRDAVEHVRRAGVGRPALAAWTGARDRRCRNSASSSRHLVDGRFAAGLGSTGIALRARQGSSRLSAQ